MKFVESILKRRVIRNGQAKTVYSSDREGYKVVSGKNQNPREEPLTPTEKRLRIKGAKKGYNVKRQEHNKNEDNRMIRKLDKSLNVRDKDNNIVNEDFEINNKDIIELKQIYKQNYTSNKINNGGKNRDELIKLSIDEFLISHNTKMNDEEYQNLFDIFKDFIIRFEDKINKKKEFRKQRQLDRRNSNIQEAIEFTKENLFPTKDDEKEFIRIYKRYDFNTAMVDYLELKNMKLDDMDFEKARSIAHELIHKYEEQKKKQREASKARYNVYKDLGMTRTRSGQWESENMSGFKKKLIERVVYGNNKE